MNRIIIEFSGDDFAARDIGAVNEDHGDVAEVVSYTLDKSSGLLFDKCRARLLFSWSMLESAHVAKSTCCKVHILQNAHVAS